MKLKRIPLTADFSEIRNMLYQAKNFTDFSYGNLVIHKLSPQSYQIWTNKEEYLTEQNSGADTAHYIMANKGNKGLAKLLIELSGGD